MRVLAERFKEQRDHDYGISSNGLKKLQSAVFWAETWSCQDWLHSVKTQCAMDVSRSRSSAVKAELSPDNASILVCGGGGIALDVTRKLKDMGAWVWMLQRSDSRRCIWSISS